MQRAERQNSMKAAYDDIAAIANTGEIDQTIICDQTDQTSEIRRGL
jgi:hypothetical protein